VDDRMTTEEIRIMYRDAKNKKKQLCILAEINLCKPADIRAIINGETDELPPVTDNHHRTRTRCLKKRGLSNALADKEKQDIISLYLEGMRNKDIADKLGRSQSVVSRIINNYKEGAMTFTEEQTPEQNEKLLQEITEKIADKPQPEIPSIPTKNVGVVEIAGGLLDYITHDLQDHIVEIRRGKDCYTVRVENEAEGVVLTRRHKND